MFTEWKETLIRGYNNKGIIVYSTGSVINMNKVEETAKEIFSNKQVRYIHMRSAAY